MMCYMVMCHTALLLLVCVQSTAEAHLRGGTAVQGQVKFEHSLLQEVTRSWFSSLFCTALPAETAVRIWDVLFLEGPKILFRTALALFKVCAPHLVGVCL